MQDQIQEITQGVIAVIVVAGGGAALVWAPQSPHEAIVGFIGVVLGYYFGKAITADAARLSAAQQILRPGA